MVRPKGSTRIVTSISSPDNDEGASILLSKLQTDFAILEKKIYDLTLRLEGLSSEAEIANCERELEQKRAEREILRIKIRNAEPGIWNRVVKIFRK